MRDLLIGGGSARSRGSPQTRSKGGDGTFGTEAEQVAAGTTLDWSGNLSVGDHFSLIKLQKLC